MGRYLLDTTALIAMERGYFERQNLFSRHDDVAIAAISLAELLGGIIGLSEERTTRSERIRELLSTFPVLSYDEGVGFDHALLLHETKQQGRPRGAHDLLIAATAKHTKRVLITADRRAFDDLTGVTVLQHE